MTSHTNIITSREISVSDLRAFVLISCTCYVPVTLRIHVEVRVILCLLKEKSMLESQQLRSTYGRILRYQTTANVCSGHLIPHISANQKSSVFQLEQF